MIAAVRACAENLLTQTTCCKTISIFMLVFSIFFHIEFAILHSRSNICPIFNMERIITLLKDAACTLYVIALTFLHFVANGNENLSTVQFTTITGDIRNDVIELCEGVLRQA